jgi:hypothetical protein|tara:strand:+ start:496 stop:678 length:183 start_codon:yes stop_codon:yes gene_type:complete
MDYEYLKNYFYALFPLFYCDREYDEDNEDNEELPHAIPFNRNYGILITENIDDYCEMIII